MKKKQQQKKKLNLSCALDVLEQKTGMNCFLLYYVILRRNYIHLKENNKKNTYSVSTGIFETSTDWKKNIQQEKQSHGTHFEWQSDDCMQIKQNKKLVCGHVSWFQS